MVLLDAIVQPAPAEVPRGLRQPPVVFQPGERRSVTRQAVGDDQARRAHTSPPERPDEEAPRGGRVPRGAQQELDDPAGAVDRAVKIPLSAADADVRFVDVPRAAGGP